MNFEKVDLLNYEELEQLLILESPNDRAKIICNKLKKYIFSHNGFLYKYNNNLIVYEQIMDKQPEELITVITGFISASISNLSKEQTKLIKLEHKSCKSICENCNINKMMSQIIVYIKDDDEKFLGDFYEIHFKNGYIDMKTLEFKQRVPMKHYVTNYIRCDYKTSSENQKTELLKRISKIYPIKEDLRTILFILGSGLTGKATKEQKILFLLGEGSNGKSVIMNLTKEAIQGYMDTLEEEAFSMSNRNPDKTFSTFHGRPHVRVIWNNEPKADQMNATAFKKFVEGEMKGKLLYKNGTFEFNHNALPIFTANIMPNLKIDGGVKRRFRGYNHTSTFTTNKALVDESKHIYFTDRDFLDNIKKDGLLNTWVEILAEYGNKWINGEEIPFPINFQTATDEMMEVNDHIQDFVDSKIKLTTNGKEDRIGKNQMMTLFSQLYPKRNISIQQLISLLKPKINWDKEIRCPLTSIKGCFINCQEKLGFDDIDEAVTPKPSDLDGGLIYDTVPVVEVNNNDFTLLQAENKQLYLEIELLKAQLLKNTTEKQEIKLADNEIWSTKDDDNKSITQEDIDFLLGEPELKIEKKIKKNKKV